MVKDEKFHPTYLATVLIRAPNTPLALDSVLLMVCSRDTSLSEIVSDIYQPHTSVTATQSYIHIHTAQQHSTVDMCNNKKHTNQRKLKLL